MKLKKTVFRLATATALFIALYVIIVLVHEWTHELICENFGGKPISVGFTEVKCSGLPEENIRDVNYLYSQLEIANVVVLSILFIGMFLMAVWYINPLR